MKRVHFLFTTYFLSSVALLLFSYTQVDLNLTLSRAGFSQYIQKGFQYIGYYQRPVATGIYISIVVLLSVAYVTAVRMAEKKQLSHPQVWRLIWGSALLLLLSYPAAFSYDFFNYLFTAKTILVYHQNPYMVTPLQYAGIDPWTNFMRWTHLSSAYTPLWIAISTIPYLFGLGYFISVLFATKFVIACCYIASCFALVRIMSVVRPEKKVFALTIFALNPLLLVETLVSGHNDIVLVMFALFSILFYVRKQYYAAWLLLGFSIATKLMTLFLVPIYLLRKDRRYLLVAMLIGLGVVLLKREFLPWYWVWVLPFVAINYDMVRLLRFSLIVSITLLVTYAPYLYFGDYSVASQMWKFSITWGGIGLGSIVALLPRRHAMS